MAPNFSKNLILKGMVDYFCLVCETYLKTEADTYAHISKPVHQKNLDAVQYFEEFKEDHIKKTKNGYFCELCNKLLTVLPRVQLHVTEQVHNDNKNNNSFKRIGNSVIAFGCVVISEQSWNSLKENYCIICDVEYEDGEIHKNKFSHIFNLIQKQVEFDKDKNIYRKIDELCFHCLTCNIALNSLTSHFTANEHRKQYQTCCNANIILDTEASQIIETKTNTCKNNDTKSAIVTEDATKLQGKIQANKSNEKRKEKTSELNKQKDTKDTQNDKETETLNRNKYLEYIYDEYCEEKITKILDCKNYITLDENNKTWCILCDWVMDPSNIAIHINGQHHQTILKMHRERVEKMKNKCINNNNKDPKKNDNSIILNSLSEFQKNNINVNFESNTAICRTCSKNLKFDYNAIKSHILEHKKTPVKKAVKPKVFDAGNDKVSDRKKSLFTSPVFLKPNDNVVKFVEDDTENVSNIHTNQEMQSGALVKVSQNGKDQLPETEDIELIDGAIQISSPKIRKLKTVDLLKVPAKRFIENMVAIENMIFKDVVLNNKYCINFLSLSFLHSLSEDMFKCLACERNFHRRDFETHNDISSHSAVINDAPVIIYDDSEFIREIRPGCYHCGYCNCVEKSWEDMEAHLKLSSHTDVKNSALWRLEQYRPRIAMDQFERQVRDQIVMDMLINKFF